MNSIIFYFFVGCFEKWGKISVDTHTHTHTQMCLTVSSRVLSAKKSNDQYFQSKDGVLTASSPLFFFFE